MRTKHIIAKHIRREHVLKNENCNCLTRPLYMYMYMYIYIYMYIYVLHQPPPRSAKY